MVSLIENGVIKPNERLPSLREFANSFHVSLNTAIAVYDSLERDRYVRVIPQSGYYVSERLEVQRSPSVDILSLDVREVGLSRIATVLASSGSARPSAIDLGLSYLPRDLIPAKNLRLYTDEALRFHRSMTFPLLEPRGYAGLRDQIAVQMLSTGVSVNPGDILITSGCQASLLLALQAVAPTGSYVALESPVSFSVLRVLEGLRLKPIEIPCTPGEGLSLEALTLALERFPVSAVVTNGNFRNPTGELMPDEKKRELVRLLFAREIPLIEDDVIGDLFFAPGNERPATCLSYDRDGAVIYCSSFSKSLSPNLQLGWVIPGKRFTPVDRLLQVMSHGMSAIPQLSMTMLLEDGFLPRHFRKVRGALRDRVPAAREAVLSLFPEGTRASNPSGGMSLWVTLPDGRKSEDLYARALAQGILIAPGWLFGESCRYESSFRMNAGVFADGDYSIVRALGSIASELPKG